MDHEIPSTSYDSTASGELHSNDVYFEDVQATFWVIFVVWLMCSVAWIVYCFVSHTRELKWVEKINREHRVSRIIEMQRLLQAYNSVDIENGPEGSWKSLPPQSS